MVKVSIDGVVKPFPLLCGRCTHVEQECMVALSSSLEGNRFGEWLKAPGARRARLSTFGVVDRSPITVSPTSEAPAMYNPSSVLHVHSRAVVQTALVSSTPPYFQGGSISVSRLPLSLRFVPPLLHFSSR